MVDPNDGLIDTNVFIHAEANNPLTPECRDFLAGLARGTIRARIEPLVVHELTYALPRLLKGWIRADIAAYLLIVLAWPGIVGEVALLQDAVRRWNATPGLGVVDAYLAAVAVHDNRPVYTKNVRDLVAQGVTVPDPLPDGTAP